MKLFCLVTITISLLVLTGYAIAIHHELRRLNNTIDGIREMIPMSGLGN